MTPSWAEQSNLDRMVTAVELVRDRLRRAAAALELAHVPYAIIGGNAVASWVATADPAAVRNTATADVLLRRGDLDAAEQALAVAGFVRRHAARIDFFQDGATSRFRDSVHVVIAGEKVKPGDAVAAPDVGESVKRDDVSFIALETLVRMKLTSFRHKDQVHLIDMIDVGLIDESWKSRFPQVLGDRLLEVVARFEAER